MISNYHQLDINILSCKREKKSSSILNCQINLDFSSALSGLMNIFNKLPKHDLTKRL